MLLADGQCPRAAFAVEELHAICILQMTTESISFSEI